MGYSYASVLLELLLHNHKRHIYNHVNRNKEEKIIYIHAIQLVALTY